MEGAQPQVAEAAALKIDMLADDLDQISPLLNQVFRLSLMSGDVHTLLHGLDYL